MSFLLCKTLYKKRDTSQIVVSSSAEITWETSAIAAVCDQLNHDTSFLKSSYALHEKKNMERDVAGGGGGGGEKKGGK